MILPPGHNSYSEYFSACCKFLDDYQWIFNFPVTEIFVRNVTSHIPETWVSPLSSLSDEELCDFPVDLVKDCWPDSLLEFCHQCEKLKAKPPVFNDADALEIPELLKTGVTPKKTHEVDNFVPFIHSYCKKSNINNIVDIGSGLGYLDLFLYLKYNYKILGIEYGEKLVQTSRSSYEKLQKSLPENHAGEIQYIVNRVVPESLGELQTIISDFFSKPPKTRGKGNQKSTSKPYIVPPRAITPNLEEKIETLNLDSFHTALSNPSLKTDEDIHVNSNVCLVGLHTCGDLCIDSLDLFLRSDNCKLCILLACCYHKLSKAVTLNSLSDDPRSNLTGVDFFKNFPLSLSLKEVVFKATPMISFLQIPFLRLAANETAKRWSSLSKEKHENQLFHTSARAVIQLYLHQNDLAMRKTKRRCVTKINVNDFNSYLICFLSRNQLIRKSGEIVNHDCPELIDSICKLWEEMKLKERLVKIILSLQAKVQFVAESLVIIDRVRYLLEKNMKSVEIVRVLDDSISPRALALCVRK